MRRHTTPLIPVAALACAAALAGIPATSVAATAKTPPPSAWTNDPSDVADGYATLNGTLQTFASGSFYFEYGPTTAYGSNTPPVPVSASTAQALEAASIPVAPGAEYHYQLVVTNKGGTVFGGDQVFDTQPDAPTIGSGIGGEALSGVLSRGVPLLFRADSTATITVNVFISPSVAVSSHVITHAPQGGSLVWLGSNRVQDTAWQLTTDTVPVSARAARLLSKLGSLTLTVQATAEANGVVSDVATKSIVLKGRSS